MSLSAGFELVKGAKLAFPRFTTPGPVQRHLDAIGYEVTTGIGPDLMQGARAAVSGMIDLLTKRHHLCAVDAYMLCSVCADLRISEIVDQPKLGRVDVLPACGVRVGSAEWIWVARRDPRGLGFRSYPPRGQHCPQWDRPRTCCSRTSSEAAQLVAADAHDRQNAAETKPDSPVRRYH